MMITIEFIELLEFIQFIMMMTIESIQFIMMMMIGVLKRGIDETKRVGDTVALGHFFFEQLRYGMNLFGKPFEKLA